MNYLYIEKDSYFTFSGGEVHLKLEGALLGGHLTIVCLDYTMNGLMALMEMVQIVRRESQLASLHLIYPYLPYARQDRLMVKREPFSLQIFCSIINSLNFDSVKIHDPHSDVGPALLNRCVVVPQAMIASLIIPNDVIEDCVIVSPDAGAFKKISQFCHDDSRIAIGQKFRDESGKISRTHVYSPVSLLDRNCLIIDDICDGGRTFSELAKELRAQKADNVLLYVTHGIFSKGFEELSRYIDHIYTTNSFKHEDLPEFITQESFLL